MDSNPAEYLYLSDCYKRHSYLQTHALPNAKLHVGLDDLLALDCCWKRDVYAYQS